MMEHKKKYSSEFKRVGKKRPPKQYNKNGVAIIGQRPAKIKYFPGE